MALEPRRSVRLGVFRLDPDLRLLFRGRETLALRSRVFDTLLTLAEKRGEIVTKEELLDRVWPDTVVEENNLNQSILALRRVLEAGQDTGVRIETVARRGYRLICAPGGEAVEMPAEAAPPATSAFPEVAAIAPAPAAGAKAPRRQRALLAAVVCALALSTGQVWRMTHAPRPISGIRSIAVLPLKGLDSGGGDALGLGLADAVITRLGYVRALSVRSTSSVRPWGDPASDPVAAGKALRVDAVLDGRVQRSGERLRVTVQLIGVPEGSELWSNKFDVKAADLFAVEDAISEAVVRALNASLSAGETRRVGRDRPTSPEAYRAYLEGRYFWNQRTAAAGARARQLFEQSIALDPGYAPAYAGLADALNSVDVGRARVAARKALALDETLAEAHAALGNASLFAGWDVGEAAASFRRAIDLNPSYATAHQWYAYCFLWRGDLAGASQEIRRAQTADPLSPSIGVDVGLMLYYGRRYEEAIQEIRRVLDRQPGFVQAGQALELALLAKGDLAAAMRECLRFSADDPDFANGCQADVAARSGDRRSAEARLQAIATPGRWIFEARVALALDDRPRAITALETGYNLHDPNLLLIGADPFFDGLRSEPRFLRLLEKIGLTATPTQQVSAANNI